jgi:hypothetical protein
MLRTGGATPPFPNMRSWSGVELNKNNFSHFYITGTCSFAYVSAVHSVRSLSTDKPLRLPLLAKVMEFHHHHSYSFALFTLCQAKWLPFINNGRNYISFNSITNNLFILFSCSVGYFTYLPNYLSMLWQRIKGVTLAEAINSLWRHVSAVHTGVMISS